MNSPTIDGGDGRHTEKDRRAARWVEAVQYALQWQSMRRTLVVQMSQADVRLMDALAAAVIDASLHIPQ